MATELVFDAKKESAIIVIFLLASSTATPIQIQREVLSGLAFKTNKRRRLEVTASGEVKALRKRNNAMTCMRVRKDL